MTWRYWLGIFALNAALAVSLRVIAPAQPVVSDRAAYEYVGQNGLAPGCPVTVYCYRILVPVVLDRVPLPSETRWRLFEALSNIAAGFVLALAVARAVPVPLAPLLATMVVQAGYGFTFTAYDPYTADPFVFLISATFALAWIADWPVVSVGLAVVGGFVKETVALVATAAGLGALFAREPRWRQWAMAVVVAWLVVLGFHWVMDTYAGWTIATSPAARFAAGSWLAVWSADKSAAWIAFLLFVPFGFVWVYALLGYRYAPPRLRALALGAAVPMLALNYVQNPERALANAFFVVIPLAAAFLARLPSRLALLAVVTNGLLTAKVGLSTVWLPQSRFLLIPAALSAAWAIRVGLRRSGDRRASDERAPL